MFDIKQPAPPVACLDISETNIGYSPVVLRTAHALLERHYANLLSLARAKRRRARLGDTLLTVDLLHDSWLRLEAKADFVDDAHFVRAVNLAMRHVIIDHARACQSAKRGGGQRAVTLDANQPLLPEFRETPEEIVAMSELLGRLEDTSPRWLMILDARYFGGMTEAETAQSLGMSERTVRRDWRAARDWLAVNMGVEARA